LAIGGIGFKVFHFFHADSINAEEEVSQVFFGFKDFFTAFNRS